MGAGRFRSWPRGRRSWRLGMALAVVLALAALATRIPSGSSTVDWGTVERALAEQRWSEARDALRGWVGRHPDDGRAWLALGSVSGLLHQEDEAREALARVRPGNPAFRKARVLLGDLAFRGLDLEAAEQSYRDASTGPDGDPSTIPALEKLLGVLLVAWRKDEARPVLARLHRLTGDARHLITWTGIALEESQPQQLRELGGEVARVERDLDRLLSARPEDPVARRARGLLRLEQGKLDSAEADLEAARARFADDPVGRLALAECRMARGDLERVVEALGAAPTRPPLLARWWLARADVEEARAPSEPGRVVDLLREAVEADPWSRAARHRLGRVLIALGRLAEGRSELEHAERLRRATEELERGLQARGSQAIAEDRNEVHARLCLELGLRAEARGWLEQSLRDDPTRRSVLAELATLRDASLPDPSPLRARAGQPGPASAASSPEPADGSAVIRFEDIAARAGITFRHESGADGRLFIADTMGGGVGLLDADGDGRLDVYLVGGCALPLDPAKPSAPNRLYRNRGDGGFEDITTSAGVAGRGHGMGCVAADYDGDGDDDLYVTGFGSAVLYRNNGDATFTDVTASAGVGSDAWTTAAAFADLDSDGDLDLVVVTYVSADPRTAPECHDAAGRRIHCPPGKFPAVPDHLFRNNGDGTFTDVGPEAGFDVPDGRGLGLAVADFDDDGRLDVYVANDAVPDFLWRNLGGLRFEEVAVPSGTAYNGNGLATASMGVVADDLDGDGRVDLFHTNFRNEGATFLRNLGGGMFLDGTASAGLDAPTRAFTGFGVGALDADNDGDLDLFVANGHVDDQPWLGQPMAQRPLLLEARASGRFHSVSDGAGAYFAGTHVGRGAAVGDLDGDGRLDLVVAHRDASVAALRNTTPAGHWLSVRLVGGASSPLPVGAVVRCRADGRTWTRRLAAGTGYLTSHDPRLHFGLGKSTTVESLEVRWPSGKFQALGPLDVDQRITVSERAAEPGEPRRSR